MTEDPYMYYYNGNRSIYCKCRHDNCDLSPVKDGLCQGHLDQEIRNLQQHLKNLTHSIETVQSRIDQLQREAK